jgi:ribokinase
MSILNLGSLNIDRVFRAPRIVRAGETIASRSLQVFAGGKGANQSVALAHAGAEVVHAGKIGPDGRWLLDRLRQCGVDTSAIVESDSPTGQGIIQVDDSGQNAIVVLAGSNAEITSKEVDRALDGCPGATWLLVQNETSAVAHAIESAKQRGLRVALNPAPLDDRVREYPLTLVDLLCVNQIEAAALSGQTEIDEIVESLAAAWPECEIVVTLGPDGAISRGPQGRVRSLARRVTAVDTTAAGDTFLGYYLASHSRQASIAESLEIACRAAALCVTRAGALDSIPRMKDVEAFAACR